MLAVISVLALVVPFFIAAVAALFYVAISGAWNFRIFFAMFVFALFLLYLPKFVVP